MLSDDLLKKTNAKLEKKEQKRLEDIDYVQKHIIIAKLFIKGIVINKIRVKPSNIEMNYYLGKLRAEKVLVDNISINSASVGKVQKFLKDNKVKTFKEGVSNAQMRVEIDKLNQIIQNR